MATRNANAATTPDDNSPAVESTRKTAWWMPLVGMLLIAALLCAIGTCFHGKTGFEKTMTRLVLPVGFGWLMLGGLTLSRFFSQRYAAGCSWALIWFAATLVSTAPLADASIAWLETRETPYDPNRDPPIDVLVVLGGGTNQGPGRAQAAAAGDRVLHAAQLYAQGHALRLITTGEDFVGGGRDPSQQTIEIWTQLGIPRQDIDTLPGINTSQEILAIAQHMPDWQARRVGVLTSAWHLPRAMRLARAQGIELIPVAANYLAAQPRDRFTDYLPMSDNLQRLSIAQHEFMAGFIRR